MPSPPRPILKAPPSPTSTATCPLPFPSSRNPMLDSPRVHFPPTPTMTQTEMTHSSFTYDRKPIVVLPNNCALPERGERAMDHNVPDVDYDLEVWPSGSLGEKKRAKGGYFHPRAYEAAEYEATDNDQAEQSPSSLLFARDPSSFSASYRVQNDTLHDVQGRAHSHFRPRPSSVNLDSSDPAADSPVSGHFNLNGQTMDAYQFIQHIPNMDLSLPFLPPKAKGLRLKTQPLEENDRILSSSSSGRTSHPRTTSTNRTRNTFERTRKVVSITANAGCGGFNSGFCEPGLEGCLGGF